MQHQDGVAAEKARLRERFQASRLAMSPLERADASQEIRHHVWALPEIQALSARCRDAEHSGCATVGMYYARSARGEVDVTPLFRALQRLHLCTALPRVTGPGEMTWHSWHGDSALETGRWGLREPSEREPRLAPPDLAAVIVPGVAFGADGSRLGWGGGFYDRTLPQTDALTIGVTFDAALADTLPTAAHDARVDVVVTERRVIRPAQNTGRA